MPNTQRYVVELTKTVHTTLYCFSKEEVARYVEGCLASGSTTLITITKRCESEESSASDVMRT